MVTRAGTPRRDAELGPSAERHQLQRRDYRVRKERPVGTCSLSFSRNAPAGIAPDIVSYSVTISACEKGGQWEHTLELLHEMRQCAMQHPGNDANPAPGMTGCSPRRTPKQNQDFPPLYADPTVVQARGTSSPRQDMISDPSVHWPHTSPRQRQRMGNASTPRRVDISGCDFPHGVEPGGKVQSGQPAQPGHSAQDSDGNSLVCVKNTFIDLAPQTPKTRGQRRSMPTLPAGIGVYYS